MAREAIPTWFFVLVVVRRGDSLLLVEERKHGGGWYLPAGRVEPGETFVEAAVRETFEESGLAIEVDGLLRVEHTPRPSGARVRLFLTGRARDPSAAPRAEPNEHTLRAAFHTFDQLDSLGLRSDEVRRVFRAVLEGAPIAPISSITSEGAPW